MKVTKENIFEMIAALHNGTSPLGMGFLHATGPITADDARRDLEESLQNGGIYLDYYRGRPIKINFVVGEVINPRLYDRDAGEGRAKQILSGVRS
jgi:hypothetical protein